MDKDALVKQLLALIEEEKRQPKPDKKQMRKWLSEIRSLRWEDTGSAPSPEVVAALALCHRLRDGAARMTRQQFRNCLNRSIGATKDYADNVRVSFQDNPAAFLAHRNPQSQSHELLRVLLEITKEQNEKLSD